MPNLIEFPKKEKLISRSKEKKGEIILYGDIGAGWMGDSISAKEFSDALKSLDGVTELDVRINSRGGDVFEGITMYNRLKQFKGTVTVYVDGMAASIASIIALAGNTIKMGEGTYFMIHKPWTFSMGNALELENTINRLDDVEEQMVSIYRTKTSLSRSEIKDLLAKETWMEADKAIEYGFASEKIEGFKAAACCGKDCAWIKNFDPRVKKHSDIVQSKVKNLRNEILGQLTRK